MQSKAATVEKYLAELSQDRREALQTVRQTILDNLPQGYEEGMQYGMIGYYVPHSLYPDGYHCDPKQPLPFASLASQKNYMSIYLCMHMNRSMDEWFRQAWAKTGKKLDMGKSCIRFKKLDDLPLKVIGQAIKRVPMKKFIQQYESALQDTGGKRKKKTSAKKTAGKSQAGNKSRVKKKAAIK